MHLEHVVGIDGGRRLRVRLRGEQRQLTHIRAWVVVLVDLDRDDRDRLRIAVGAGEIHEEQPVPLRQNADPSRLVRLSAGCAAK
jgi:hypothetical protein